MKHVTIVVPEGDTNLSSITGTYEILKGAHNHWLKSGNKPMIDICIAGFMSELALEGGFFSIHPVNIETIRHTDLLVIPSVSHDYNELIQSNQALVAWIRDQYKQGAEVASMCSGAFLLAATGLLDGKTCSMHWNRIDEFRRRYPNIKVAEDKIISDESGIYTNGGAYSFLNLVLYLVEKLFDRPTAIFCSKLFQIDIQRTTQSAFSIFHIQKGHGDELIGKAQTYIEENIDAKISFEKLASDLAISRRNFDRRFIKATGNTPVEYLQRVKVEAAKKELERGRKTVFEIMNDVGYSDDKAFREVFRKVTGLAPLEYRARYNKDAVAA